MSTQKSKTKVVHVRDVLTTSKDVVYIGRPSKWGNPYIINKHGTRDEVIDLYTIYASIKFSKKDLAELKGKKLACFCKPKKCHGDILAKMVEKIL